MPRKPQDADHARVIARRLGSRLRHLRKALHLTQEEVSERIELTSEAYARIERGFSLPSYPTLMRLCEALDTTPDALLVDLRAELQAYGEGPPEAQLAPGATAEAAEDLAALFFDLKQMDPKVVRAVARLVRSLRDVVDKTGTAGPGASRSAAA